MKRALQVVVVALLILPLGSAWAQDRTVTGKVTSADDGSSLPGVNVVLKGTTIGTNTDVNGNYSISVPSSGGVIVFSFIGLKTQEIEVGSRSVLDLQMQSDVTQLSEVVVTGYGTTLKKEFSGVTSTVSSKDIAKLPLLNVSQALQGQAAGVHVVNNSGTPGGGISVRVRGQTSINASNDPLYVIDGVPVVQGALEQGGFNGQTGNALAALNPQDIESIEVLKDASSAAIYGARAANGVVLITTKRGKTGKTNINFSTWTGWSEPTNINKLVNAQEWVDIKNEARVNSGLAPFTNAQWGWDGETDTDWMDLVFRTARTTEYQLGISGGDQKTTYYISGSYRDQEGTLLGSGYRRATGRINLDHKATEIFSFGTTLSIASDLNRRINNDNNIYGIYSAAILTPPTRRVVDDDGNYVDALPSFNTNAVRDALESRFDNKTLKIIGNFYTNFKITDGLDFRTDFSYDYNAITEDVYLPATVAQGRPTGSGTFRWRDVGTWVIEPTLRFSRKIKNVHSVNAVAGLTFQDRKQFQNSVTGVGFARPSLTYITSAATITAGSSFRTDYSFNSVFGRVNYAFNEKYLFSASIRQDGSSRFGENNKFALFYAVSAGWNFSDEPFMQGIQWLSLGKLRASYGTTGNDGIANFPWQGAWTGGANYLDNPASAPTQIANPDLKWETTATLDIGVEFALFDNRLNINTGVFQRRTTDLLYNTPLANTTGFNSVLANIGEIENKGFEFDANAIVLNKGGLRWSVGANVSAIRNKVVKLVGEDPILSGFASAIIEGQPLNAFYGLRFLGVDPATGQSIFKDTNGDGIVNTDDREVIGKAQPDWVGGITTNLSYKGLTLDVLFQFVQGVDIYNNTYQFAMNPGANWGMDAAMRRRWKQPGDITDVPIAQNVPGLNATTNTRWLLDGSYLRLKNIILSYDLPQSIITKAKLRSARVFVTGENLLTFTKYYGADPEVSTFANTSTAQGTDFLTFPQSKMVSVGLNLGF